MRLLHETRPHVAIIDLMLEEGSGMELIKQIKAADSTVRMIVCSMHDDNLYTQRVLQAGAMGYVNKNDPAERVIDAIRRVLAGRIFVNEAIADRILRRVAQTGDKEVGTPVDRLSDRELEVLGLLGQGMTTRQMAEKLNLSTKTIDTYREHLKTKLDLDSATALIRYAVTWSLDPDSVAEAGAETSPGKDPGAA
jgi:DNA-binding NarL/FixJ family response regulator